MKKLIPANGFGTVQRDVMKMKISAYSKLVYCLLMTYKGDKEMCYPSLSTISSDLEISKSTVIRAIKELEDNSLLHVLRGKKESGENTVNKYIPDVLYQEIEIDSGDKNKKGGGTPQTPRGTPQTLGVVSKVDHKNNSYKINNKESLISNEESVDSSPDVQIEMFKETSPKRKKEKKEAHPAFRPMVDFFCKEYWPEYSFFGARDGKAINSIIKQCEKILEVNEVSSDPEDVVNLFRVVVSTSSEFYQKKNLPMVDSKFSEMIEDIKKKRNGKNTVKGKQQSSFRNFDVV